MRTASVKLILTVGISLGTLQMDWQKWDGDFLLADNQWKMDFSNEVFHQTSYILILDFPIYVKAIKNVIFYRF